MGADWIQCTAGSGGRGNRMMQDNEQRYPPTPRVIELDDIAAEADEELIVVIADQDRISGTAGETVVARAERPGGVNCSPV